MNKIKHIQAEVNMEIYDHLRHISQLNNTSLKETIREAVVEYIKRYEDDIMEDSLFNVLRSFTTKQGNWSERDDWRE